MKFFVRIIRRQMERQSTTNASIFCRPLITKTSGFTLGRRLINELADNEASALAQSKHFFISHKIKEKDESGGNLRSGNVAVHSFAPKINRIVFPRNSKQLTRQIDQLDVLAD
jgi:hypothetical protein